MKHKLIFLTFSITVFFHFSFFAQHLKFSSIQDIEGNIYKTVQIDEKEWMIEDLRTIHFDNNDKIELIQDRLMWSKSENSAVCKDSMMNSFYNFFVIQDERNICPSGWHISTYSDWDALKSSLKNLEQSSKNDFNLLMEIFPSKKAGRRYENGVFLAQLQSTYWWVYDESGKAYFRTSANFYSMDITEEIGIKNGLSIRCVKN